MRRRTPGPFLLAALLCAAGCRSHPEASFDREPLPRRPADARGAEPRWSEAVRPEAAWPEGPGLLLEVERWGRTRLVAFRLQPGELLPVASETSGEAAFAHGRLVHLAAPGIQPSRRFLEIREGPSGRSLELRPAEGFALLGFALSTRGEIAWLEFDTRTARSRRLDWRIWVADPGRRTAREWATSASGNLPTGVAPVPLAWAEATGEILLGGIRLFRALAPEGLYALRPDGTVRELLDGTQYVGRPRVSPDGTHLAWLASDPWTLPPDAVRIPGAPLANRLVVRSLAGGGEIVVASPPRAVFETVEWSDAGREVLVTARTLQEGRFGDTEILSGMAGESLELRPIGRVANARVAQVARCESGSLFWIEDAGGTGRRTASLRCDARRGEPLLSLDEARLRIVACLGTPGAPGEGPSRPQERRG